MQGLVSRVLISYWFLLLFLSYKLRLPVVPYLTPFRCSPTKMDKTEKQKSGTNLFEPLISGGPSKPSPVSFKGRPFRCIPRSWKVISSAPASCLSPTCNNHKEMVVSQKTCPIDLLDGHLTTHICKLFFRLQALWC